MSWLDRYLDLFEGEPAWLIVLVSMIFVVGCIVIVEKMIKLGTWIVIAGLVAAVVIGGGLLFLYW